MKKINFLFLAILIFLTAWAGKGIFKYNVYSTHDGDHHFARSFDVVATINEGHFPLRWAGSLNYGCGVPIYNFFYPLLYYLVALANPLTQDIFLTLKIISFLSLLVGTLFFYLWLESETRDKLASFAGAVLYLYAPYRFLLIFVRGSPEYLAYALLPVVLYLLSLTFKADSERKFILLAFLTALAGGFLTIAHNFTVMFLMPIILLYLLVKIWKVKLPGKRVFLILFSYLSAFGLGAFFIGPAFLEKKYTKIGESFLEWQEHFPTLKQVLRSPWGYFYSAPGIQNDGMSFQLGYAHWLVLGLVTAWFLYRLFKKPLGRQIGFWPVFFWLISAGSLFLILPYSKPIWEMVPLLQSIQFSWRLLGVAVFAISALSAFWLSQMKEKRVYLILLVLISALAVIGNRNHLLPQPVSIEDIYRYDDFEHLHPHRYSTTTLADDVIAPTAPQACWFTTKPVESSEQEDISYKVIAKANTHSIVNFVLEKSQLAEEKIILGLSYFPGAFNLEINGVKRPFEDCQGRVCFPGEVFQDGPNQISWQVQQTPIQNFFNYVTLLFLASWGVILFFGLTKTRPKRWQLIFLAILAVFSFLRFYHLPQRVGFGWDEERDVRAVKEILSGNLQLIGPRVLSDTGFFLPPYFFYLLAPFYFLSGLSPTAIIYFLVFYNLVFFGTSFWFLKRLFSQNAALLFLAFWAVNPHTLSFDTVAWNPVLVPLAFIALLYLLKRSRFFLLGIVWGLGVSFHFQFLLLGPLFLPLVLEKKTKALLLILGGFVLSFLPLAIFDLRHNFLNLKLAQDFLLIGRGKDYLAFLPVWDNVVARIFALPPSRILSVAFYLLVAGALYLQRKKALWQGLFYIWLLFPLAFAFYGVRPSEYYFNFTLVIIALVFAYLASRLEKQTLALIVGFLAAYFTVKSLPQLRPTPLGLQEKTQVVQFLGRITQETSPFNLSFTVPLNSDVGWRYLLDFYQVHYSGNAKDPLIQIVIPPQTENTFIFERVGLQIPESWISKNWLE